MKRLLARTVINRQFGLLWAGQTISYLGDRVFDTTLILWIATRIAAGQRWTPLAVSGVLLAVSIPTFLAGPLAGVFADRWDKRRTMLQMDAARALLVLLLLPITIAGSTASGHGLLSQTGFQLGAIYAVVALTTVCTNLFGPSRATVLGDVVPEADRTRAASLTQTTITLSTIVGPAIAAPIYFALGARGALIMNAASFVVSFALVYQLRPLAHLRAVQPAPRTSVMHEFGAGLRFFAGNRVLVVLLVSLVLVLLGYGAVTSLNIFFLTDNLHTPARYYGLLGAAAGAGLLAGSILSTVFARRIRPLTTLWLSILALGILDLTYARMTGFIPALVILFLTGLPGATASVIIMPLVLEVTPRDFVGRVVAVITPATSLASMCSIAVAGLLISTVLHGFHAIVLGIALGPIDTVFSFTGVLELVAALVAWISLRGVTPASADELPQAHSA